MLHNSSVPKKSKTNKFAIGCVSLFGVYFLFSLVSTFQQARDTAQKIKTEKAPQEIAQQKQKEKILKQNFNSINEIISGLGGSVEISNRIVKVHMPGPVSEYDAKRLAKVISDKIGDDFIVKIYDDAGLIRAEKTFFGIS